MEYELSDGRVIPLRRVARRYLDLIRAKHTLPEPPTYTFTAAGGVEVTKTHDQESAEQSGPEDLAAWNKYRQEHRDALAAQATEVVQFLVYHCIAEDPPPVEEWSVDFKLHGLEPPADEDPIAFKSEWFQMEIITDEDDYAGIMTKLYECGGLVDSDQAQQFEALFRLVLERLAAAANR